MILVETMKRALKYKGLTYKEVASKWNLSESSVKRLFSQGDLSLDRIHLFCELLGIQFSELMEMCEFKKGSLEAYYTFDQETAFVENPKLLNLFVLLQQGLTVKQIESKYQITKTELQKLLLILNRLQLIELRENNKLKLLYSQKVRFNKNGPMGSRFVEEAKTSYLQSEFKALDEHLRFATYGINPGSYLKYKSKIDDLLKEIQAESEIAERGKESQSFAFLIAMRPWQPHFLRQLKLK